MPAKLMTCCWGHCQWASLEEVPSRASELLANGEISEEEHHEYRWRLIEARNPDQVVAAELFECCVYDFDRRATIILEVRPGLSWLPEFSKLTHHEFNSPLVYALSRASLKVAKLLLDLGPDLIKMRVQSGPYTGATALHLAVINGCQDFILDMLERLESAERVQIINQQNPTKHFHGHTMLLALSQGFVEIFYLLLEYGGDLDCQDQFTGDSVLHVSTKYGQNHPKKAIQLMEDILNGDEVLTWYCNKMELNAKHVTIKECTALKRMLLKVRNNEGYTPIFYAAMINSHDVLNFLIRCEGVYRHTVWKMGSKSFSYYDMLEIDPVVATLMSSRKPNVLDQLIFEGKDGHLPALNIEPIHSLMKLKWSLMKPVYFLWALIHLIAMAAISHMSTLRSEGLALSRSLFNMTTAELEILFTQSTPGFNISISTFNQLYKDYYFTSTTVTTVIVFYFLFELYDVIMLISAYIRTKLFWQKLHYYKATTRVLHKLDEFDLIQMLFQLAAISWIILDQTGPWNMADTALSFALITGWYFMLYFMRAYPPSSYFTVMVNRILFSDLLRFALIMVFIILGFSSAFRTLMTVPFPAEFITLLEAMDTLFYLMVGMGELAYINHTSHYILVRLYSIVFISLATIALLNMLIAAMAKTYDGISQNKETLARKLQVKAVMKLERLVPNRIMSRLLKRKMLYSTRLGTYLLPVYETETCIDGNS